MSRRAVAFLIVTALACTTMSRAQVASPASRVPVYLGTYTDGTSKGIYRAEFDQVSATLSPPVLVAELANPSFLAWHPTRPVLYAVSETDTGAVVAFAVGADGGLTKINEQPSGGGAPCYVAISGSGTHVLVANYVGGSVASFAIRADGGLEPAASVVQHRGSSVTERQAGPHAHSIIPAPGGALVVAADLGMDRVLVYALDAATGRLLPRDVAPAAVRPGSGPRHLAFHPSGEAVYVMNELSSSVTTYAWDAAGATLTSRATASTLPASYTGPNTTAEVAAHPNGRFVYGSNRGHDSIAVFRVNADRSLAQVATTPTGGQAPRHFAIDPSGRFLLVGNQRSGAITVFRIDEATGTLTPTGPGAALGSPVCIRFRPAR